MPYELTQEMKVEDLISTHIFYNARIEEWKFLMACYDGIHALKNLGVILQHERESDYNYNRRLDNAFSFGYTKAVVDIFNFYLFKSASKRIWGETLSDYPLFKWFLKDCNQKGDEYEMFFLEAAKYASIFGHVGILVDKSPYPFTNLAQQMDAGVYPYYCIYWPTAILDWEWDRDEYGKPYMSMIKLVDDDYTYRIWTPDAFQVWQMPEEVVEKLEAINELPQSGLESSAILVAEGINPLGEIPFVYLYNTKSSLKGIGISDVSDISHIDLSIVNNMSQAEEIVEYAAFPMMRKPYEESSTGTKKETKVGVTAILRFDPDNANSKPDWLSADVAGPIGSIMSIVSKKIEEIYRSANIGGMQATEMASQSVSGVALKSEFHMLNSKLMSKATHNQTAEEKCIELWLRWENQPQLIEDVSIERAKSFDIEDLAADLGNAFSAQSLVSSVTFSVELSKQVVRWMMPTLDQSILTIIDAEIEQKALEQAQIDAQMQELNIAAQEAAAGFGGGQQGTNPDGSPMVDDQGNPVDQNGNPLQ
jgi:hypothetical protein